MIEKLYLNGVDAKEISRRIDKSVDAIRKYIQRNLKDLKEKHEFERERTKEIIRKTKWECSQEISNMNFAKFNKNIYVNFNKIDLLQNKKAVYDSLKILFLWFHCWEHYNISYRC